MDVVYVCRKGPNDELRFSLRSLVNLPHDRVWLFGAAPPWYTGGLVACPQASGKQVNVKRALRTACEHPEVSDPFILMNDDFYAISPVRSLKLQDRGPVRGVMADHSARRGETSYVKRMRATLELLESFGYRDPLSFELHTPLVIHKAVMLRALDIVDTDIKRLQHRTIYGALLGDHSTTIEDVKVFHRGLPVPDGPWLSSGDSSFGVLLLRFLEGLFPDKCDYEEVGMDRQEDRYVRMRKGNTTARVHVGKVTERKTRGWRVDELPPAAPVVIPQPAPEPAPAPAPEPAPVEAQATPELHNQAGDVITGDEEVPGPAPVVIPDVNEDMLRRDLDTIAKEAGVDSPFRLPNKAAVIASIEEKRVG